jgi:hypothetical protein
MVLMWRRFETTAMRLREILVGCLEFSAALVVNFRAALDAEVTSSHSTMLSNPSPRRPNTLTLSKRHWKEQGK